MRLTKFGVFQYDDVRYVITNHADFSSANNSFSSSLRPGLLQADPPYHKTLRSVISSAFTPTIVAKLKPRIEEIAHELLNKVVDKGQLDLISDLAYPLVAKLKPRIGNCARAPVTIIAELLGVPIKDRNFFIAGQISSIMYLTLEFNLAQTSPLTERMPIILVWLMVPV